MTIRHRCSALLRLMLSLAVFSSATPAGAVEPPASDPLWLDFVEVLMTAAEVEVFADLDHEFQKRDFVEAFWLARDPDPSTPRNELREVWSQRLSTAESLFAGTDNHRARTFLLRGAPDFILADLCSELLVPIEIWLYEAEGRSHDTTLVFSSRSEDDEPRLWDPARASLGDLLLTPDDSETAARRRLARRCRRGRNVLEMLSLAEGAATAFPASAADWLPTFVARIERRSPAPLDGILELHFPYRWRNRTVVDGVLRLDPFSAEGATGRLQLEGEVYRGDRRADHFRYVYDDGRIDLGGGRALSFRRHLAPGSYRLLLTLRHLDAGGRQQLERALRVPALPDSADDSAVPAHQRSFKLRPLPLGLLTGPQRVEVITSETDIAKVVFRLDDEDVMSKSRPPFSIEVDLGETPRTHLLEAVALAADGRELASDRVDVNVGPHRFGVRLIEPRRGRRYQNDVTVQAEVEVPPGNKLDRLDLYFNEDRAASLYQPPFVVPHMPLTDTRAASYVRAVAVLDDGHSAEDLVVINTGGSVDQVQVDLVELYVTAVDRKGSAVRDLLTQDFSVLEDGTEQQIRRLETVRDLPINAVMAVDTSTSMETMIQEAEEAALSFFSSVIQPKDRAAVIVFNDKPELRVALTNDLGRLAAGLSDIQATGETTLYDAVIFGLYYLAGLRGKTSLIVVSDGVDSASRASFRDALDFARRSGTAIYGVGIGISARDVEGQRVLRQLAKVTGGGCFFIERASELDRVYARIEEELRSQYLIAYQSSSDTDEYRRVEVLTSRRGVDVRSIPGYYP